MYLNLSFFAVFCLTLFVRSSVQFTTAPEGFPTREESRPWTVTEALTTTTEPVPTFPPIPNPVMIVDLSSELAASSSMSQSCVGNYARQFTQTVNDNLVVVKQIILSTPSFCPGATDAVLLNAYSFMTVQGTQVVSAFGVEVDSIGTNTFEAVSRCTYQVGHYLQNFNNWLQPIIRDVANCPRLTFVSTNFTIDGLEWVCNAY